MRQPDSTRLIACAALFLALAACTDAPGPTSQVCADARGPAAATLDAQDPRSVVGVLWADLKAYCSVEPSIAAPVWR